MIYPTISSSVPNLISDVLSAIFIEYFKDKNFDIYSHSFPDPDLKILKEFKIKMEDFEELVYSFELEEFNNHKFSALFYQTFFVLSYFDEDSYSYIFLICGNRESVNEVVSKLSSSQYFLYVMSDTGAISYFYPTKPSIPFRSAFPYLPPYSVFMSSFLSSYRVYPIVGERGTGRTLLLEWITRYLTLQTKSTVVWLSSPTFFYSDSLYLLLSHLKSVYIIIDNADLHFQEDNYSKVPSYIPSDFSFILSFTPTGYERSFISQNFVSYSPIKLQTMTSFTYKGKTVSFDKPTTLKDLYSLWLSGHRLRKNKSIGFEISS